MGIHILIVEAENRFRKNLYTRLQLEGFTVDKVTHKDDVVTIIAKEKIDTVLLGVDGLGREGLALIRPIKTISPTTEIIIINDSSHMVLSIEGMELGAFDDFMIPLDIDSLATRIREAAMRKNGKQDRPDPGQHR
jgi:DNA-binding response OmpR family regulator